MHYITKISIDYSFPFCFNAIISFNNTTDIIHYISSLYLLIIPLYLCKLSSTRNNSLGHIDQLLLSFCWKRKLSNSLFMHSKNACFKLDGRCKHASPRFHHRQTDNHTKEKPRKTIREIKIVTIIIFFFFPSGFCSWW